VKLYTVGDKIFPLKDKIVHTHTYIYELYMFCGPKTLIQVYTCHYQ